MPGSRTDRTVEEIFGDVLSRLAGVQPKGTYAMAYCPAHPNSNTQALSVMKKDDGVTFKCHGARCSRSEICQAIGLEEKDLYVEPPMKRSPNGRARLKSIEGGASANTGPVRQGPTLGCTLSEYASDKGLPEEWLKEHFGLRDKKKHPKTGAPAVEIPYHDEEKREVAVRYRTALRKGEIDRRFLWKSGANARQLLYGLEKLSEIREDPKSYVVLVEGESDVQTLRYHDIHALGVPGAENWNDAHARHFEGIEKVYAVIEQGTGGETFRKKLSQCEALKDRLLFVDLGEHDDPSGLYLDDPENFKQRFREACEKAVPFVEKEEEERAERVGTLWENCKELAEKEDILAEFEADLKRAGVVGQAREAKIIYLASTSRCLERPSSIAIKGASSTGKSFTLNKVLEFIPEEGYYKLTAMSDKALAYFDKPLKHRHLVIAEAAGIDNSEMASYLTRTLLSEGYLQYAVPLPDPKEGNMVLHEVRVEGPSGLFITTTQQQLHQENETRMLSITVNDTRTQTRSVIRGVADRTKKGPDNMAQWHALQRWITMGGRKEVVIPYAMWLADSIPEEALHVRLRRDFTQVLNLIDAHAILHQATREKDEDGRIVATCQDYRAVRGLLCEVIAEGLEASVSKSTRRTVAVVCKLYEDLETKSEGVTIAAIKDELKLDRSAAYRRVQNAMRRGFVKNLEDRKGRPARYAPGDPLPDDIAVLPEADELVASGMCRCATCSTVQGVCKTRESSGGAEDSGGDLHTSAHLHTPPKNEGGGVSGTVLHTPGGSENIAHLHTPVDNSSGAVDNSEAEPPAREGQEPPPITDEQRQEIADLVSKGVSPKFARRSVLGDWIDEEEAEEF